MPDLQDLHNLVDKSMLSSTIVNGEEVAEPSKGFNIRRKDQYEEKLKRTSPLGGYGRFSPDRREFGHGFGGDVCAVRPN
jgi:hypothetical protein